MSRSLLHEVAFDYVRTWERKERYYARGQEDAANEQHAHIQDMERCLNVTETSSAWREPMKRGQG